MSRQKTWTFVDMSTVPPNSDSGTRSSFTPKTLKLLIRGCEVSRGVAWTCPRMSTFLDRPVHALDSPRFDHFNHPQRSTAHE